MSNQNDTEHLRDAVENYLRKRQRDLGLAESAVPDAANELLNHKPSKVADTIVLAAGGNGADHIEAMRERGDKPHWFAQDPEPAPAKPRDNLKGLTASQKLAKANGDPEPRL